MKASLRTFTILVFFLHAAHVAFGQATIESITNKNFLNGYAGKIAGKDIGYHSFHPYATDASGRLRQTGLDANLLSSYMWTVTLAQCH